MLNRDRGLTGLTRLDLERILRSLHREELRCPVTPVSLTVAGLAYLQDRVEFLVGLDQDAVRATVTAVLYERMEPDRRP